MPVPDQRTGNICVWLISCFFLIAIITGGIFLFIYILLPETESSHWFPVAGVMLVAIPWFFWLLTFLYRCISRTSFCGGRGGVVVVAGGGGGGANAGPLPTAACGATSVAAPTDSLVESPGSRARRVRFGAAIVVSEQDGGDVSGQERGTSSSSSISNEEYDDLASLASRESEIPLASSMSS